MPVRFLPGELHAVKRDVFNPDRPYGVVQYLSLGETKFIDGADAVPNSRSVVIAEVTTGSDPHAARDDATLFAAAPDLYWALRAMLEKFESDVLEGEAGWDAVVAARQALDRAEDEHDKAVREAAARLLLLASGQKALDVYEPLQRGKTRTSGAYARSIERRRRDEGLVADAYLAIAVRQSR